MREDQDPEEFRDGEDFHERESDSQSSVQRSKERDSGRSMDGSKFVGTRIPQDLYRRLYRDKARLEMETGGFYGISRLMERALRRGLAQIERELDRKESAGSPGCSENETCSVKSTKGEF